MKILNLYAGIGGNRKLWGNSHKITAVELNPNIAKIYQEFFLNDEMVITDAHKYLLEHYKEFDFIWSSPPCQSHSQFRYRCGVLAWNNKPIYPDMGLYEEIIFLKYHFKGKYVVENVIGYYEPLIKPQKIDRHYFWTNFTISDIKINSRKIRAVGRTTTHFGFSLVGKRIGHRHDQILRNMVNPKLGLHVFQEAFLSRDSQEEKGRLGCLGQ